MRGPYDTERVVFSRAGTIEDSGNTYPDPDNVTEIVAEGCAIEAGDTREEHERASGSVAEFTVWAPIELDVHEDDTATFDYAGRTFADYKVDGRPRLMPDPNGVESHQLISLVKREG